MMNIVNTQKLISIASPPLSRHPVVINLPDFGNIGPRAEELLCLLKQKNGFYAFESALHVFPAAPFENEMTLSRWNSFGLWRFEYAGFAEEKLFFAEDIFGNQFCVERDGWICSFDAETGDSQQIANSIEEWATRILTDYEVLTGYPLSHEWQTKHGRLEVGKRLMPRIPFNLGGEYALRNLYPISAVSGMKTRGNLARQIRDLPDGSSVEFRIIE